MYLCTKFDAFVQICTFIPLTALTTGFPPVSSLCIEYLYFALHGSTIKIQYYNNYIKHAVN